MGREIGYKIIDFPGLSSVIVNVSVSVSEGGGIRNEGEWRRKRRKRRRWRNIVSVQLRT